MRRRTLIEKDSEFESLLDPITGRGIIDGYEVVDLNLPSGTLWATYNVGGTSLLSTGNYYMYGKGNRQYNSSDSKYTGMESPLNSNVDTATLVMGKFWHTPTRDLLVELINYTNNTWTTLNTVKGRKFTRKNNSNRWIFFPAAGYYESGSRKDYTSRCNLWSSSSYTDSDRAFALLFTNKNEDTRVITLSRTRGLSVRGTHKPIADPRTFVDLGLPSGTLWSKYNIVKNNNTYSLASSPELIGCYFSWGNIEGHNSSESYNWGSSVSGTYNSTTGASLTTDITPDDGYDAAYELLGNPWQIPTSTMFQELFNNCTVTWVTDYKNTGVAGVLCTSNISGYTDKSIFFPAGGTGSGSSITQNGTRCHYWSATRESNSNAYGMRSYNGSLSAKTSIGRYQGKSIRPVIVP